jgi:hypothetical protein
MDTLDALDAQNLTEAYAKWGIVDPEKELAEHHSLHGFAKVTDMFKEKVSPALAKYMSAFILVGYKEGLSDGRFDALQNPGRALQAEYQALRQSGVTEAEIATGIQQALEERTKAR